MLSQESIDNIRQQKLNALASVYLHTKRISKLRKKNLLVEFLSLAVPAFYIVPRFLAKGTNLSSAIEVIGEILAAILLVLALLKLVYKWQDDEIRHSIMLRKNADIALEADQLLTRENINIATVEQFLRRVQDVDDEDNDLLLDATKQEEREAYREALKKFEGRLAICPVCGANPWHFKQGSCDACGGTPVAKVK
jgi:mobilome CxxCx(11)CxxC protein